MSTEVIQCSLEGPTAEEIKAIVDKKYAEKNRWVGGKAECCKEFHDEPFRKLFFDLKTGWGASENDPETLHSMERALEVLEEDNFIQYVVYLPDDEDDAAEVAEMNNQLCPIEMEVHSQPTYCEVENVETVPYSQVHLSEDMMPVEFLGYIVDLSCDIDHAVTLRIFDVQDMAWLINEYMHIPPHKYSDEWVAEKVEAAMNGRESIILCNDSGYKTMVSRMTAESFGGSADETVYKIERFGRCD